MVLVGILAAVAWARGSAVAGSSSNNGSPCNFLADKVFFMKKEWGWGKTAAGGATYNTNTKSVKGFSHLVDSFAS
uniref:Uncharacterized protein n=1 Tax=Tanacetum cinerariifolium TaxID=118510 RepID=A0A699XD36_TANCI|nr:hypothetical protein [Tanacetum cinerariifolium]